MNKKVMVKYGSILVFVLIAGLFYSCRLKEQAVITLEQEESKEEEALEKLEEAETSDILTNLSEKEQLKGQENPHYDSYIYVHVCGAVENPAVYKVKENSRIADVIQLAGGLKEEAADSSINQASIVTDGQQIYVPTKEEFAPLKDFNQREAATTEANSKIDINKATLSELMTLPGIGKAKAESIVAYREDNGGFTVIEDIMRITGIKENVFNKIKDFIDVK